MSTHIKSARLGAAVALTLGPITLTGTAASAVNFRAVAVMSRSTTATTESPSIARHTHGRHDRVAAQHATPPRS